VELRINVRYSDGRTGTAGRVCFGPELLEDFQIGLSAIVAWAMPGCVGSRLVKEE
jgi:hypothetical protein